MKKLGLILLLSVHFLRAPSAITQYAVGPGFNVYRNTIDIVLSGGMWGGLVPPQILATSFPDGPSFAAQVQAYDAKIGNKFAALKAKLIAEAQKNPLWATTMAKIADLDKQVAAESAKKGSAAT